MRAYWKLAYSYDPDTAVLEAFPVRGPGMSPYMLPASAKAWVRRQLTVTGVKVVIAD